MIEFIPLESYKAVYFNLLLIVTLFVFIQSYRYAISDAANTNEKRFLGITLLLVTILYVGLRPVSYVFGDMGTYAFQYADFVSGTKVDFDGDFVFYMFMKLCSSVMPVEFFFLLCMFFYTYPLYLASVKLFDKYWFYSFFILIISLSFWSYGTNGIRNGLATSVFLLAVVKEKKVYTYLLLFLSVNIHHAMIVPIVMYFVAQYYTNTKYIFLFWLLCIPLSLALGSMLEAFFLGFGFGEDEKLQSYLVENEDFQEQVSKTGFRWDFLIYSASGVFAGLYFIFKKKLEDVFYSHIFNTYLLTNAIWILVIRANFSNRFAYLSWFMLGLVIIYPMLKYKFFNYQHRLIGKILLAYFILTYLFNLVL
jgi:hypothetical protein